jgi:hypothetical protein
MSGFIFMGGMTVFLIGIVVMEGFPLDWVALAFAVGFALVCSIGQSFALSVLFPVAFSEDGIYGHSFWGRRRFIRWQGIASVRKFRLLNLRWLRLYATDGEITWLALFQSRGTEFRQEVRRLAPPNSPVLLLL